MRLLYLAYARTVGGDMHGNVCTHVHAYMSMPEDVQEHEPGIPLTGNIT